VRRRSPRSHAVTRTARKISETHRFEPPNVAAVCMTRGPFFIKAFAASWRFSDAGDAATHVSFKYFVDLHRPFGFLMPFVLRAFARETQQRIEGLKRFCASPSP
jgi:hypothetical protein